MKKTILLLLIAITATQAQTYTSYITGNPTDLETEALGGICLMGGASEDDNAMQWFLERANGGDILVLRASGSDGYNNYMYSSLGVTVNSVETIVFHNAAASNEAYIHQKIQQAEAIWFAGGDQWNYVSYWRDTPIATLINEAIQERNVVVGGTSAGMAIQGGYYFSAQNGTVTSSTALANPFANTVTVDNTPFIQNEILSQVITDTHFDSPDRKGRLTTFLARIHTDYGTFARAIACDEYTAVCIDTTGIAKVFGGHPTYDDNAYFIQHNCAIDEPQPEICNPNTPLTWNHNGEALKVYQIKGNEAGNNSFSLVDWETASGGQWLHWSVTNGIFAETDGTAIDCTALGIDTATENTYRIYPNPVKDYLHLYSDTNNISNINIYNSLGQKINTNHIKFSNQTSIDTSKLKTGMYIITITNNSGATQTFKFSKK